MEAVELRTFFSSSMPKASSGPNGERTTYDVPGDGEGLLVKGGCTLLCTTVFCKERKAKPYDEAISRHLQPPFLVVVFFGSSQVPKKQFYGCQRSTFNSND